MCARNATHAHTPHLIIYDHHNIFFLTCFCKKSLLLQTARNHSYYKQPSRLGCLFVCSTSLSVCVVWMHFTGFDFCVSDNFLQGVFRSYKNESVKSCWEVSHFPFHLYLAKYGCSLCQNTLISFIFIQVIGTFEDNLFCLICKQGWFVLSCM